MKNNAVKRATEMALATVALAVLFAGQLVADEGARVFDVPKLDGIVIDGTADDWKEAGFHVDVMTSVDGWVRPVSNMDSRVSIGWDERGLLVLIRASDQNFIEATDADALYASDSVELYMIDKRGGKQMIQAVIAPGMTPDQPELRYKLYDYRTDAGLKANPPKLQAARTKTPGGYVMEVLLPWANIGVAPELGGEVAFQVFVNDKDGNERLFNTVWYPATGTFMNPGNAYRLRLANRAGQRFASIARGFARLGDVWFSVIAATDLAGKNVGVRFGGKQIGSGTLLAHAGRALACVQAKLPDGVGEDSLFEVAVEGQTTNTVGLMDLENERGENRLPLRYAFRPFVFAGESLPPGGFEDAAAIERLLGPHEIKVSYRDAAGMAVTNASAPGRYGAVVEIVPRLHPPLRRYFTLFRLTEPVNWQRVATNDVASISRQLGVDPGLVDKKGLSAGELLRGFATNSLADKEDGAILLAWMRETPPGAPATQRFCSELARARWMHELMRRAGTLAPLKYWVQLPGKVAEDKNRRWPTILYLHGAGDRGQPVSALSGTAAVRCPRELKPDTFIVIAPRCPAESWWSLPAIEDLLKEVLAKYPIDEDRLYLTGASMGGFAAWAMAAEWPERFAAIVPLCGGGDPREAVRFKDVPVWAFHGARDKGVKPELSREMVEALRGLGGRVRYTEYPDLGHNCWDAAYGTAELYDWLLGQVRGKPGQPPATAQQTGSK
jgi:pimeloyl-ACP methyl ester carboxylesterase